MSFRPVEFLRRHRRRILLGAAALTVLSALSALTFTATCGFRGCPSIEEIRAFRPSEGGRVVDRRGQLIGYLEPVRRINVALTRIPRAVREAFIAVEDRRFASHEGIDWRGVGRALWRDLTALSVREGASTITMQVARSGWLPEGGGRSLGRKLIEFRLAPRIEEALSKDQILELYLNLIYLGEGTYGVEAASRHYFGKSVSRLSLAEAATLAGLPRAPAAYNPRTNPERAKARRNLVLSLMAREGFITTASAEAAGRQRLRVARRGWSYTPSTSWAVEAVRPLVAEEFGRRLPPGEFTVYTTFDRAAQRAAERAVRDRAAAINRGVQGAMVAIDPRTGDLLATVGGAGDPRGGFDRATRARRQPGSAFKPFVYAAALESGLTPATMVDDTPVELREAGGTWRPANYGGAYAGPVTLRTALAHSANAATVRVSQRVGVGRVATLAGRMGVSSRLPAVPSLALGSAEVSPLELVGAYAPFANGGWRVEPRFALRIEARGRTVWRADEPPAPGRAIDPVDAFLVTSMLRSAVDEGTGAALRRLGVYGPVAGKTGTTNDGADVWFVGYTPTILAGFWFGYDTPRSLGGGASGGRLAAPAWASFYRRGWQERETGFDWEAPGGLVEEVIDTETGLLAGWHCPNTRVEWFRSGMEPRERCRAHDQGWDFPFDRVRIAIRDGMRVLADMMDGR